MCSMMKQIEQQYTLLRGIVTRISVLRRLLFRPWRDLWNECGGKYRNDCADEVEGTPHSQRLVSTQNLKRDTKDESTRNEKGDVSPGPSPFTRSLAYEGKA